jgi:hypothetical protein
VRRHRVAPFKRRNGGQGKEGGGGGPAISARVVGEKDGEGRGAWCSGLAGVGGWRACVARH